MENYLKMLYKRFLYGTIASDDFLEMRHGINNLSAKEMQKTIGEEWENNSLHSDMNAEDKESIKSRLNLYIAFEKKKANRKRYFKIAAVLIPAIVLSTIFTVGFLSTETPKDFVVLVKPGSKAQITLPDNSVVWLNSNSKLVYSNASKKQRNVRLVGEAFFKVTKNASRPFIVSSENLAIEVLGTSFNVKAPKGAKTIETTLLEGSVKLSAPELHTSYYLKPNEKAIYSTLANTVKIIPIEDTDEVLWKDNVFYFESESFGEVINRLENWYGRKIVLENQSIEKETISGSFRDQDINTILKVFRIQFGLNYRIKNDTIYLY